MSFYAELATYTDSKKKINDQKEEIYALLRKIAALQNALMGVDRENAELRELLKLPVKEKVVRNENQIL